nr:ras and Rab interactor 2 isoform X2 [Paramormyrops kingsleyae]
MPPSFPFPVSRSCGRLYGLYRKFDIFFLSHAPRSPADQDLIDSFASEIGELKQEMVQTAQPTGRHSGADLLEGLEGEVSGVYLQSHPGATSGARDSGYDSLRRRMSVLDRLAHTHAAWLLLSLSDEEAGRILQQQPCGTFLVRKSARLQRKVLSLRVDDVAPGAVSDFPIRESQYTFSLEGSGISFADLFRLVAFYCISRDVLPFTLRLPEAIATAKTQTDLEQVAQLGAGFWESSLCRRKDPSVSPSRGSQVKPPQPPGDPGPHLSLRTRAPSQLERGQSNGALCFVNPLFLQAHRLEGASPPDPKSLPCGPALRTPPPRPPPPRSLPRRPAPPPQKQRSMPETAAWTCPQPQPPPSVRRGIMGAKLSGLTFSTPKRSSAPIPVPPPRLKKQYSMSDADGLRCQIALDERTIEKALSQRRPPAPTAESPSPPAVPGACPDARRRSRGEPGQRLSDVSISTSSSDSLEYSHSYSLSGPSPPSGDGPAGDSSEEEDDDMEEEEEDYGMSVESDQEVSVPLPFKSKKLHVGGTFVLRRALKGRLRKVSGVFNSFMTPERRAVRRIAELARDKGAYFGCLVQDYVSFLQENRGSHTSGLDLLQTLRQFMTQMKAYLRQSSELDPPIESLIPEDQIDQVLEKAMHKCVLKPLRSVVETALMDFQVTSGAWQQLRENLALAKAKQPQELGVDCTYPPDPVAVEKIRHKFHNMRKMYSPEKKVALLLRVCKLIYTIMEDNSGRKFGADDFLPMLTYVLAQCDMPQLDLEIQYMMELLDPSLLHGEGGYYLTSAYGAMSLIKNFQEEQAARVLSSEARNTLHQWHRRRTAQRTVPSVDDFQNYLRVALQEADSGCTAKTLLVHPYSTTDEVCVLCSQKFSVQDPESYALFLLIGETSQQLAPDTYPQRIKAEIHSRPQPQPFHFVYRKVPNLNLCGPTDQQNGNCLSD